MRAQVLGPKGEVWAVAPDETWNLRGQPFPPVGVKIEGCWQKRFVDPPQYGFAVLTLDKLYPDGMSSWKNEHGSTLIFNPDFWRYRPAGSEA